MHSHRIRLQSRNRWVSLAAAATVLGGCTEPDTAEEPIASSGLALMTTTVSLQDGTNGYAGTIDTQIAQSAVNTNYATATTLLIDGDQPTGSRRDYHSLIRWDLSSIPPVATVSAVTLTFWVTNPSSGSYSVYALKRSWTESGATWNRASSSASWQTAGGQGSLDRDTTAIGTLTAGSTGSVTLSLTTYGASLVNGWVANPTQNFGFIIANSNSRDGLGLASSEYVTVGYRPKLTVTYSAEASSDGTGGAGTGGTGTGGTRTGGTRTGGTGTGGTGTGGTGGAQRFGFFVWSDSHVASSSNPLQTALTQMRSIDGTPIGAFSAGDFTDSATASEWDNHIRLLSTTFDPTATVFGGSPRYLGVLGNHDTTGSGWYNNWTSHMSGQARLGHSGNDGIYYSLSYRNVLFVGMDSEHVSGSTTSHADAQTKQLESALAESTAQFKFAFFHRPVYSCNSTHGSFGAALPWLDLAEKYNVDAVFTGHSHVYTRTCRMKRAVCTNDGTGTIHVETGTVGGTKRTVNVTSSTVSGTDSTGAARSDTYRCNGAPMVATRGAINDFCYVRIDGSLATVNCYAVGSGNTTPFDAWQINSD